MDDQELDIRFTYHACKEDQIKRFQDIRGEAKKLARTICAHTPESREQSIALTKLDEVVMFANAAIARREEPAPVS